MSKSSMTYRHCRQLLCVTILLASAAPLCLGVELLPAQRVAGQAAISENDWPWWRGPNVNGVAEPKQQPPLTWSKTENVIWKTPVPGRGHSSPTVVGERVFLATAEEDSQIQSVLCFDRQTGKQLWKTDIHKGNLETKGNKKSSQASSTVACDGERLFINFVNGGAMYTTALDLNGRQVWQTKVADFKTHQGFGSSPALFGALVFVTADSHAGGAVAALDREKGRVVWQEKRPEMPNYASPVVLTVAGKEQLLVSGCELVTSFEPLTGKKNWEMPGSTTECVTTMVTDGKLVFVSGGYPKKHTQAIRADGSRQTAWENTTGVYVPSMVVDDGHLFALLDAGVATCWKSDTGEECWKARLSGTFSASLVLVGDHFFATNESGTTYVFKANPNEYEAVAENQLGDAVYATPAICGGRIYMRVVEGVGADRQEMLYCLGNQ